MSIHASVRMSCDENVNFGKKSSVCSLTPQFHFNIQQKVFRLFHLSLKIDNARVRVQPSSAEVVFFISLVDSKDYVVSSVGRWGSNTENMSWDHDVGLEVQLVIGNAHRGVLAVQVIKTTDAFTPPKGRERKHVSDHGTAGQNTRISEHCKSTGQTGAPDFSWVITRQLLCFSSGHKAFVNDIMVRVQQCKKKIMDMGSCVGKLPN